MKTARALVLIGVLGAASIAAGVYTRNATTSVVAGDAVSSGEPQAQAHLVGEFAWFAGSELNARSLVAGLRQGKEVTLVARAAGGQPGTATRFFPPTRPMDFGNVRIALALAREQLAQLGITRPTPTQIKAVLAGGGIASHVEGRSPTPFLLPGVLQMRAGGMSWARIAGTMGVTLAQSMNGAYPADAAVPMDSARPAAARAARRVVPASAAGADAPALRRAGVTQAPISSASIATSSAGGPTTRAVIRRAAPARRTAKDEPTPEPRRSKAQVMAEADGTAGKEAITVRAPDSAQREAVGTTTAAASADEPARSANEQPVD